VTLRVELGHLEAEIEKLQTRCNRLKKFVRDVEAEISGPVVQPATSILDGKFRKVIDSVFGETPKRPKR